MTHRCLLTSLLDILSTASTRRVSPNSAHEMDGCVPGGRSAGFSRIVLLVEACDSGSMLDGMRLPEGVYAVTATRPGENSCEMMVALSRSVAPSISLALKA